MAANILTKTDELRLRTLQRLMIQRIPKHHRTRLRLILNPANLLLVALSIPAAVAVIFASIEIDQLPLGLFGLTVQTSAIIIFFAFPRFEKIAVRIVLAFYIAMYTYLLVLFPESHGIYIYAMFIYPAFAYVSVGYIEGLSWSMLLASIIGISGIYHLSAEDPTYGLSAPQLIVAVSALLSFTLFIHIIDMVAKFSNSDLRQQTGQLEHANARYDFVLNSIGDGFVATDKKGIIEFISDSALEMTGFSRKDVINVPLASVLVLLDQNAAPVNIGQHPLTRALGDNQRVVASRTSEETYKLLRHDHSSFPVGFTMSPIKIAGETAGAVMLFHDTSVESQIDHAKSEFVSLASHQLRTPLNVISWYAEKLQKGKGGELNERGVGYLEEIATSNKRMIELVGAILNVSRIELGRLKIQYSDVDIIDLTKRLIKEVSPLAEKNGIEVKASYMSDSHILQNSDVEHTTVIVQNLLSNAVKYTGENGTVEVAIEPVTANTKLNNTFDITAPKDGITIAVSDTGIGIPAEQQDQIFGKLFRADNAQTAEVNGTGLGLYVTKSLVEQMGGSIWFKSKADEGSTFTIFLPNIHDKAMDGTSVEVNDRKKPKNAQVIDFISEL